MESDSISSPERSSYPRLVSKNAMAPWIGRIMRAMKISLEWCTDFIVAMSRGCQELKP